MIRSTLIATLLLLLTTNIFAQEDSTHVVLKNGGEMNVVITKVDPWGCTLSDDKMLLFKVISELNTNDSLLISEITSKVGNIRIWKKGEEKILSFENATYQEIQHQKESGAGVKSALLGLQLDRALNYRFQVDFSIHALQPLVFSPSFSFGHTLGTDYNKRSFGLGIGGLWEFDKNRFILMLNASTVLVEVPNAMSEEKSPIGILSQYQFLAGEDDKYIFFVGGYCNLNHIEFDGKQERFGVMLGLGLNISVLSFYK